MPRGRASAPTTARVEATVHRKDTRANIPTAELGGFVEDAEKRPTAVRYPRDPSLDPQLVWKGKDELDAHDLEVPAVPIYIQEKVSPRAIVEDLRSGQGRGDPQPSLFASFDPLDFEALVDFYHHQQGWSNRLILGDSLLVMTSLAEKEALKGQVQCIYIDPPYGIKFGSNWQVSTRKRDVKDGKAEDATRQPEQVRAFRDTWELGVHSYLTYLRDRFLVARDLLAETGSIFVQIGDENVHLVRCVLDEVFGSENFISLIAFRKKTMPFGTNYIEQMGDFIIWYGKKREKDDGKPLTKYRPLKRSANVEGEFHYCWFEMPDGSRHRMTTDQIDNHALLPNDARVYRLKSLEPSGPMVSGKFDFEFEGRTFPPPSNGYGTTPMGMERLRTMRRLQPEGNRLTFIMYADENPTAALTAPWFDTVGADDKQYVVQTNTQVIKRCLLMTTDPGDLVLDPTCGSGTTAYVAEQWGRRWITCDTSRVALAVARTRLMAAKYPYYLLADSPEGVKKEAELTGRTPLDYQTGDDIRKGFVYKRAPHVTLKSIANNPDIQEGMTREQIAAAIARHADSETLYDQPYEDRRVIRVTGPFTVESLSPHRVLEPDDRDPGRESPQESADGRFEQIVLANLKAAGVQNTVKGERLVFDTLEPWPGACIQAAGDYTENGQPKRVALCIGPEHGTVSPDLVREAAKEAVRAFDLLVVCGFAFDARVGEEAKRLGRLTILKAAMNPDLALGGDILKKTRSANLFMVFGEPDIELRPAGGGQLVAEIKGIDVYDPTTGEIRSHSTDDIACWFLDTDYNEESFFVRHAYFLGAGDPYEQLRKALRAEIDEGAWASLYRTVSRPFSKPATGKIAVKVINHYGDEVLKVYPT